MTQLTERLDRFEHRLRSMETELVELRRLARAEEEPAPAPAPEPEPAVWQVLEAPAPAPRAQPVPPPRQFSEPSEPFDFTTLLGARALAWTGGAVTLLGVVFFFVLAVDRGWIGPAARVTLGAAASAALIGGGLWLRRQYGDSYASLSAAGAGIAGSYATLLAAAALYDLLPAPVALLAAATIAAVGGALALAWASETLACLGLVGAMLVPVPIALQGEITAIGTAFACLVLAAATVVAVRREWHGLHVASVIVTAPQALALMFDGSAYAPALGVAFWLVYAAGAVALALRTRISYLSGMLLVLSAAFAGWSAAILYEGRALGVALLVVASGYVAATIALYRRDRDAASVLAAVALTVAAVAAATLSSGATLTIVWAAEAAVLAWLAKRIAEPRFQVGALTWLALAFGHGIAFDARLERLFVENDDAWRGAPSAFALAVATVLVGLSAFRWRRSDEGQLARLMADLLAAQPWLRRGGLLLGGATAVYTASLVVVALPESWDRGHVLVAGLWSLVAVALVAARRRSEALGAMGATVALVLAYDLQHIAAVERSWAFAIVAAAALIVAVGLELTSELTFEPPAAVAAIVSALLASAAVIGLLDGRREGLALLAVAALLGSVGTLLRRRARDFATTLGLLSLLIAVPASTEVVDGAWLVLTWSAGAAALGYLARHEERLEWAAIALFGLALVQTLVREAPPSDVFIAHAHPAEGAAAVLLVLAAGAALSRWSGEARRALVWICGGLALYAATLGILELFEAIGEASVDTAFQRGHTAVSSLWGAVGLALLYTGLRRRRRELQFGGFALFGVALVKLFVYDLAFLSSIARAFSFLAVGALILLAGFFYQHLSGTAVDSDA